MILYIKFSVAPCSSPEEGTNTKLVGGSSVYDVGDTYTYVCNKGYEFTGGSLESTCQSGGTWSLPVPTCTSKLYGFIDEKSSKYST